MVQHCLFETSDERVAPSLVLFSTSTLGAQVKVEKAFNVVGLLPGVPEKTEPKVL